MVITGAGLFKLSEQGEGGAPSAAMSLERFRSLCRCAGAAAGAPRHQERRCLRQAADQEAPAIAGTIRRCVHQPNKRSSHVEVVSGLPQAVLCAVSLHAVAADSKETKTASGIVITTLKEGAGASPKSTETVKVHYRGVLESGKEFDSSYGRGQPATFPLNRVIPCWTEGVQTMKVGGKVKLLCPSNLAYGSRGVPGTIPPDATLIFEVELLEIVK